MEEEKKTLPDILVFMSDQHTPYYSGFYGNGKADTPNLDRLAGEGTVFEECYTSSPLCGPARMSLLSGKRPAETGIFHKSILPDTTPTFLHCLAEQGYETVLAGRMHFIGHDQYHGFTKHIAKDMTPVTWNYQLSRKELQKERGVYALTDTFSSRGAASIAGGGTSPVLEYDSFVIKEALDYLAIPHERPQFIMVSIYGPHFPYVAPKALYEKYLSRVTLPESFYDAPYNPLIAHLQAPADEQMALCCQAAYCGMVEQMDSEFGQIRDAFERFTEKRGTEKAIFYISDHGDACGQRRMFGKENFYEYSAKVPFIAAGKGIAAGGRVTEPVSLMDFGPTVLDYTGAAPLEEIEGISVKEAFETGHAAVHPVYSEFMEMVSGGFMMGPYHPSDVYSHGFMLRQGDYKYITYSGCRDCDVLYNIKKDPEERSDLSKAETEIFEEMKRTADPLLLDEKADHNFRREARMQNLMIAYETVRDDVDTSFRWNGASEAAGQFPEICALNHAYDAQREQRRKGRRN